MMKQFYLLLGIIGLVLVVAQGQAQNKATNPSQSIYQNMQAIPQITLTTTAIKAYQTDLYNKLNDPNSEKLTFFVPTDRAIASTSKILDAMLQRSGYPSLDELKRQAEANGNKCPSELSGDQCAPWNMNIGITKEQARAQAELLEKFPPGYNATDIGMKFGLANAHYHVASGEHTTASLPAHCFLQTLLDSSFEKFVGLNGGAQVMHVEDIAKAGYQNTQTPTVPSDPLQERITNIKILFGAASDPIPKETIDRLQSNASFVPGLVDNYIASVIIPDIHSANGYIHVIDKVLILPLNATTVMQASNITRFQQLVKKAGLEDKLNKGLQNITIFAPSDEALNTFLKDKGIQLSLETDLFYPETDSDTFALAAEDDMNKLQKLVLSHVVQGSYYPPYVPSQANLTNLDNKTLQFRMVNPNDVNIEGINLRRTIFLLRNGVMHEINGVLPVDLAAPSQGGAGAPSQQQGSCPTGPVIKPLPGAQTTNGTIVPPMLPSPGQQQPLPSARDLGCPETDAVCRVIDFDFLQCKTQLHTLNENERQKCARFPENITSTYSLPNRTICYNRSTHTCVHGYFLCPLTHPEVCGVQCYNPSEYKCYATMSLCPTSAPDKCGEACYNRSKYSCRNGQLVSASQGQQGQQSQQGQQQFFDAEAGKLNQEVPVHSFRFPH